MEDFILREIDKIGLLLRALLDKAGIGSGVGEQAVVAETTRLELVENLDIDLDVVLVDDDFIDVLKRDHGFSDYNIEQFAELLFDIAAASNDHHERASYASRVNDIFKYLNAKNRQLSFKSYCILKDLGQYI